MSEQGKARRSGKGPKFSRLGVGDLVAPAYTGRPWGEVHAHHHESAHLPDGEALAPDDSGVAVVIEAIDGEGAVLVAPVAGGPSFRVPRTGVMKVC